MDKNRPSLLERVGGKMYTIFILFLIAVMVFINCTLYLVKNYDINYKYIDNTILIGISQEKNLLEQTVEDYISQIEEKGIMVISHELDTELLIKATVTKQTVSNNEQIQQHILEHLDIDVMATILNIENEETVYYFISETECNNFVERIKKYKDIKYTSHGDIVSYDLITSAEILDEKVAEVQQEKEKAAAEARKKQVQVTSRSGSALRDNKRKAPLASYVYISSYYGPRNGRQHTGVDYAAAAGTHIYSWKAGTVTMSCWNGSYGNFIEVDHGDGTVSRYAHLSGYAVSKGETVVAGQTIGYVGTTGNSTGNHLHFEIKVNGSFVNPLNYL